MLKDPQLHELFGPSKNRWLREKNYENKGVVHGGFRKGKTAMEKRIVEFLREDLDLTGAKNACDVGACGACTILVNDEPSGFASSA